MANEVQAGEWQILPEQADSTVSRLLKESLVDVSWNRIRKLLSGRRISVNGQMCLEESRRLVADDVLRLHAESMPIPPSHDDVQIVKMDASFVVINKPPRMVSLRHHAEMHWTPQRRAVQPSADEIVLRAVGKNLRQRRDPATLSAKQRRSFLRSVHRLDRDASGLLVFARTLEAEQALIQQFSVHSVDRIYQAITEGAPEAGSITSRLVRDRGDGLRGSTSNPEDGKLATTRFRPIEQIGRASLVECQLETGRTHQIRIHLAESGHPICGDPLYQGPYQPVSEEDSRNVTDAVENRPEPLAPRLALHACKLAFDHPVTGERLTFESEIAPDLQRFVALLRAQSRAVAGAE
jgi:23S rRNA pseudouridine1911/1915/1917 synthase